MLLMLVHSWKAACFGRVSLRLGYTFTYILLSFGKEELEFSILP